MNIQKQLIYDLNYSQLESQLKALGQPGYRAKQIWAAVYKNFSVSL
jgi:adenine C2-methylase RlmN of 23S rRNA A2503 and tRNA A37